MAGMDGAPGVADLERYAGRYTRTSRGSSGTRFVLRSRDDEPRAPVSFSQLADGTPYLYMSGRVAPRVS
jgi:hypothetical protein